jgi:signal transduction histidine kinase
MTRQPGKKGSRSAKGAGKPPLSRADIGTDVNLLLGIVSHELRTPIQTILADAEVMALMDLPSDAKLILERMFRSIDATLRRMDSISQYVRSSSESQPAVVSELQLASLLQDLVDESAGEAEKAGLRVVVENFFAPEHVTTDGDRLHQVLGNFVANAIRHGDGKGSIVVRAENIRLPDPIGDWLEVSVTNPGQGIPPALQDTIWQPFVRTTAGPKKIKGMGLGLAVVRMLASPVGWEVGLRNNSPNSTTFFVRLPFAPDQVG